MKIVSITKGRGFKVSRNFVTWDFPLMLTAEVEIEDSKDLEKARCKLNALLIRMLEKDIEDTKIADPRFETAMQMVESDFEETKTKIARRKSRGDS